MSEAPERPTEDPDDQRKRLLAAINPYSLEELEAINTVSICKKLTCYGVQLKMGDDPCWGELFVYAKNGEEFAVVFTNGYIDNLLADAVTGKTYERWISGYPSDSPDGTPAVSCPYIGPNDTAMERIEYWSGGRQTKVLHVTELEAWYLKHPNFPGPNGSKVVIKG